jgi:hypothetical protein
MPERGQAGYKMREECVSAVSISCKNHLGDSNLAWGLGKFF